MVLFYFALLMKKEEEGHSVAILLSLTALLNLEIRCLCLSRFLHSPLLFSKSHVS